MKPLKILIVEDEVFIAETIKMFLEERKHEVVGMAVSYEEAFHEYNLYYPDLVLLDIRLYGEKSGIDFANYLKQQISPPPFIYLTSQLDTSSLSQALETNPYGYLTKPFYKESLWTSIESAYHLYTNKNTINQSIIIADGRKNHLIKLDDIIYVEADHVYSVIHLVFGNKLTVRKTMQQILDLANHENIVSCHRSFIVNLRNIRSWGHDALTTINDIQIPISKSNKDEIINILSELHQNK